MKKKAEVRIRDAGFEDVPAIYALIKSQPDELLPRSISNIVENVDRFIVCESGGLVVGAASWEILPELGKVTDPSVELKSVVVARHARGRGVGDAMVRTLIERVSVFHPSKIIVLTFVPAFFRKFGFRRTSKKTLMHKLYVGCMNCTKYDSPFICPEVAMTLRVTRKPEKMRGPAGKRARARRRSC